MSVGQASHGSFGLQPPQPNVVNAKAMKPAIELLHRRSSCTGSVGRAPRNVGSHSDDHESSTLHKVTNPSMSRSSTCDGNESMAAPSSVHLIGGHAMSHMSSKQTGTPTSTTATNATHRPFGLLRDLSDLSGSYNNGATGRTRTTTTNVVPSHLTDQRAWRHAKVLSTHRLPQHPQPHYIDDESSYGANPNYRNRSLTKQKSISQKTAISFDKNGGGDSIEVSMPILPLTSSSTADTLAERKVNRIPLILVLMDPTRKLFELLQLWIDTSIDSVRDILQTINKNLDTPRWKQDYDGLFQIRNNHFTPLIHVLPAGKYDIVPGEVWVCKPWSMTSKQTVTYASSCLNQLKQLQLLQYRKCSEYGPIWKQWKVFRTNSSNNATNKLDDTVLVLSKKATQRLYVPGGILKHHHACQFLAFVPPFEHSSQEKHTEPGSRDNKNGIQKVTTTTIINDCSQSTASGLSDSHDSGCDEDQLTDIVMMEEEEEVQDDDTMQHENDLSFDPHLPIECTDRNVQQGIYNYDPVQAEAREYVRDESVADIEDEVDSRVPFIPAVPEKRMSTVDGNGTVCSTKTKESTYQFRTYAHDRKEDLHRPIRHVLPSTSSSYFTSHDRSDASSSSSPFQNMTRRFYMLFHCRRLSMMRSNCIIEQSR
jgi:hypothetical protein